MITKIKVNDFEIYANEIISKDAFIDLYMKEEILTEFKTKVVVLTHHQFATFLALDRHKTTFEEGDYLILRASKDNKKFEFITHITIWGKFGIPKEVIEKLNINNHEIISFEIIKESSKYGAQESNSIDLANIKENINLLYRGNNYITLIKRWAIPITLPRFIEITPNLIELCFLIHGDGHYKKKLFFVNKDGDLINFVMDKFEKILGVPKETWRARLLFNNSASPNLAKEKWKINLGLKEEQFYPSISKCILNTSKNGNLRIVIDKVIVAEVFRYIFSNLQNPKGKNALYALNGLLCAEGSAEKTKNRGLHKITISFSQEEKNMFKNILFESKVLDLIKDRRDRIVIEGWINCYSFFKIFFSNKIIPFDLHKGRRNNALSGFLEHSFTKTMEKYLTILNRKNQMSTNDLVNETSHLGDSIRKTLRKKQYTRFVKSIGGGINRNPIIFSITPEGKEFLTLTKDIREVYNEKNGLR